MTSDFKGTAAVVRRALERSFTGVDPGDAVWKGRVGPRGETVLVDVEPFDEERAAVRIVSHVADAPELTPEVARAVLLENDALVLGRFRYRDGAVVVEQSVLGGPTLHVQEVRISAWAVGWAAAAFRTRIEARLRGEPVGDALPVPRVEPRRGGPERVASARERVERFLRERYGEFDDDPHWGYHGPFGSARVFCTVGHYLETSTAITVASPVLNGVEMSDGLALDVHEVALRSPLGRFALSAEYGELWFEHAVLGDDLDPDELHSAIEVVAITADSEDDRLKQAYGGRRYADLVGDEGA